MDHFTQPSPPPPPLPPPPPPPPALRSGPEPPPPSRPLHVRVVGSGEWQSSRVKEALSEAAAPLQSALCSTAAVPSEKASTCFLVVRRLNSKPPVGLLWLMQKVQPSTNELECSTSTYIV
ncbi:unnamed protein product [Pleuronectes platessa]|uniref:Uncharacterized protein n=1 Tax=Pleuronectes platessa TaxID=8262 RepID=A0A9N7Z3D5_PLEPL|nr:unnamed protein product [Pleuronectes platessa]